MSWEVGQPLQPLSKPPITREQLAAYADASGDINRIHLDEDFAKEAGFPSVIVHGMLSMAFLADLVQANFAPEHFRLGRLQVRFRKVTFPGDVVSCEGKVKMVSDNGRRITVGFASRNQQGEVTCEGEAEITAHAD